MKWWHILIVVAITLVVLAWVGSVQVRAFQAGQAAGPKPLKIAR